MEEADREGLMALFDAAQEYHAKHSRGPGGAAICVCGMGGGGSKACRGLSILRDIFRYAKFDDPEWQKRFSKVQAYIG